MQTPIVGPRAAAILDALDFPAALAAIDRLTQTLIEQRGERLEEAEQLQEREREVQREQARLRLEGRADGPNEESRKARLTQLADEDPDYQRALSAQGTVRRALARLDNDIAATELALKAATTRLRAAQAVLGLVAALEE
jgi:hypothetical protein